MDWLNFHHLYYFWRIARAGGLAKAAADMRLSHSTLSAQLKALEAELAAALFERRGRRLVLTPLGEQVASYADDIFRLGREVLDLTRGQTSEHGAALRVGVVPGLPKTLALRLLAPGLEARSHLLARQGALDVLVAELGQGRLHAVLSDEPAPEGAARRVFSHLLGESTILLYAAPALARVHRRSFPDTLASAPFLLPAQGQSLRRQIDRWLADKGLRVGIVGEFDDAGMMRVAGAAGMGLLPVRAALRAEVEDAHAMEFVGHLDGLVERYYVLSSERRTRHRAVTRIVEQAREGLAHTPGKKVAARPAPHSRKRRR